MKPTIFFFALSCFLLYGSCSNETPIDTPPNEENTTLYFPPITSSEWDTTSLTELGWSETVLTDLLTFLEDTNTKAFIILKNGKLVVEEYMNGHSAQSNWYWASAGKTLTAFTLGLAQDKGYLNLNDPSANYLGNGWSSLSSEQENAITIRHHITMTTGLDYTTDDLDCTEVSCLNYLNTPGTFWYYHNAPYTLTQSIIEGAIPSTFDTFFEENLRNLIGMQGAWVYLDFNRIYFSTARSIARFGLLCLNKGTWDQTPILSNTDYFEEMTNTSQNLNPAYGYLWWLNGKDSYRLPGYTTAFNGQLIPNAPDDLIAGLGANDQKLYIVPSQNLVIIRMGNSSGTSQLALTNYDNLLWEKISLLIN